MITKAELDTRITADQEMDIRFSDLKYLQPIALYDLPKEGPVKHREWAIAVVIFTDLWERMGWLRPGVKYSKDAIASSQVEVVRKNRYYKMFGRKRTDKAIQMLKDLGVIKVLRKSHYNKDFTILGHGEIVEITVKEADNMSVEREELKTDPGKKYRPMEEYESYIAENNEVKERVSKEEAQDMQEKVEILKSYGVRIPVNGYNQSVEQVSREVYLTFCKEFDSYIHKKGSNWVSRLFYFKKRSLPIPAAA